MKQAVSREEFLRMLGRERAGRRTHHSGQMNKAESRYAQELEIRKRKGEVLWYAFEAIKLRLADRTFYTPDFAVVFCDGECLEFHEVKGHWEDDARVKIKVAAQQFPHFRFIAIRGSEQEEF